jgi:hypothetical protein
MPTNRSVDQTGDVSFDVPNVPGLTATELLVDGLLVQQTGTSPNTFRVAATDKAQDLVIREIFDDGSVVPIPMTIFPGGFLITPSTLERGPVAAATEVAALPIGSGDGQVGWAQGRQGATIAPGAISVGSDGHLFILDSVNLRVLTSNGRPGAKVRVAAALPSVNFTDLVTDTKANETYAIEGQRARGVAIGTGRLVDLPRILTLLPPDARLTIDAGIVSVQSPVDDVQYILGSLDADAGFVPAKATVRNQDSVTVSVRGAELRVAADTRMYAAVFADADRIDVLDRLIVDSTVVLLVGSTSADTASYSLVLLDENGRFSRKSLSYHPGWSPQRPLAAGRGSVYVIDGTRDGVSIQEVLLRV